MLVNNTFIALVALIAAAHAAPVSKLHARAGAFGSCSDPTIIFAEGLDGRSEASFAPSNDINFNHGSALNIDVIASFICGQLQSSCGANESGIDACTTAQSVTDGLTGQAAADAFNTAINKVAAASPTVAAAPEAIPTVAAAASSGSNLQTFTGSLGGTPPPVTAGERGFVVNGSDFLNVAAALGRSCDVQHNACANAANSGGGFSVSDCDTQNNECHAAI